MKPYFILFCFLFATVANSNKIAKGQVDVNGSLVFDYINNSTNVSG